MIKNQTLCIVKPDAYHLRAAIIERLKDDRFEVLITEFRTLTYEQASLFYAEHEGKDFFRAHIEFMASGAVTALALTRRDGREATAALRLLVGNTNPAKADEGTLRRVYGSGMPKNAVHASADPAAAARELPFFFSILDLW